MLSNRVRELGLGLRFGLFGFFGLGLFNFHDCFEILEKVASLQKGGVITLIQILSQYRVEKARIFEFSGLEVIWSD